MLNLFALNRVELGRGHVNLVQIHQMQAKFLAEKNARHMARAQEPVVKNQCLLQNVAFVKRFGCL